MDDDNNRLDELETEDEPVIRKKFWKFWLVFMFMSVGFLAVIVRLFLIQVVDAEEYQKRAQRMHESQITLKAQRGDIYDRNGRLLATTVQSVSLAADPMVLKDSLIQRAICDTIAKYTGESSDKLLGKIRSAKGAFVWLVRSLAPSQTTEIEKIDEKGFIVIYEPKRNYLYGSVASQIIGCTDIDNKGINGIELSCDSLLKGTPGYMMMYRDASGRLRPSADLPVHAAVHGRSLQLTIDIELQRIVEYELKQGVLNSRSSSGTVVVLKPETGEILAMASYPTYNPNNMESIPEGSMRNRSVTDVYEPGSTFKMITAAAALEEKLISPGTMVDGLGGIANFGEYRIRDDHPMGRITFTEAMENSSNIIFAEVGNKLPAAKFYKYVRDFGFGLTLGIDMPGEVGGSLKKAKDFTPVVKRFLGHGYGISVTPLQIANAYSAVANKGQLMKPYVIGKIMDSHGETVRRFDPIKIRRVVSENTALTVADLLSKVVENGTGKAAQVDGLNIAGKTGTSQQITSEGYSKSFYNASFAGFFPADNPKIAMLVLLDKPRVSIYGGTTAAPIFRDIAQRWINVDSEISLQINQKSRKEKVIVPMLKGLDVQQAEKVLHNFDLIAKKESSDGIVTGQDPAPKEQVPPGTAVTLKIEKFSPQDSITAAKDLLLPDVRGLSLRRALSIIHKSGFKAKVYGSGIVTSQSWTKQKDTYVCTLRCN